MSVALAGHLGVLLLLLSRREIIIIILIVVVDGSLLGGLGEINLGSASAAAALNNVVKVNFLQAILIGRCSFCKYFALLLVMNQVAKLTNVGNLPSC